MWWRAMWSGRASAGVKEALTALKDEVGRRSSQWDRLKMCCNPYELVYTAPACVEGADGRMRPPTSRAYYKLWELVHDDPGLLELLSDGAPKRFAYVAEAPGAFVESAAMARLRLRGPCPDDAHHGITLHGEGRGVPHWKLPWSWMSRFNVHLSRGADGTGDVTRLCNVERFVAECGGDGSVDMVTADGGFDFSSDFNGQESQMTRLLVSEVLAVMRLLRAGGAAVVKVFDAFNDDTVRIIGCLYDRFEHWAMRKPRTSRPANSERYVVCRGYRGACPSSVGACESYLRGDSASPGLPASDRSVRAVSTANLEHCAAQVASIARVLAAIESGRTEGFPDLSAEWMAQYGLA